MKSIFLYDDSDNIMGFSPEIILTGNEKATVEGFKEIIEYSPDLIRLSLGKNILSFFGDSLSITGLENERITVSGDIISLSFSS